MPEQICANMTKSDKPLLEAFVVSLCPFGLQMQRIMADIISELPQSKDHIKVRYIGSTANGAVTSMHGNKEAQENLRQICIREEQPDKYWNYVSCYMKEGKPAECLKSLRIDVNELDSCTNDSARGLAYAQEDFDLADKFGVTGSPTLTMNNKIVSEFDFATDTTNGRSPEALKELLCCGFNIQPSFCARNLNTTPSRTMFQVRAPITIPGRIIPLIKLGAKSPGEAMLATDDTMNSARSQYPLLVIVGFADYCRYCRLFNVTVSELASELQGQAAFGLIDTQKNNDTKADYNITAVPTSLIFKNGRLVNKLIGNENKLTFVIKLKGIEPKLNTSRMNATKAAAADHPA
jgi:thioredoxin 1